MKVFVTGATGFIGSAVVQELIRGGHQVLGLARSEKGADALTTAGAAVQRGSLEDLESLHRGAAASDGVIHLAFIHDFLNYEASTAADRRAIEIMGTALENSDRPFIVTSGLALLTQGRLATEQDAPNDQFARKSEPAALQFASRGVRAITVRLAPSVHGDGDHGFVPMLIKVSREKGSAAYVDEGQNRWAAVHRLDAATLYRLALEKGSAGAVYHGVGDEGVAFRDIAGVIGRHLHVPVVSKSPAEAEKHFGWMAMFAGMNLDASSALTRQKLGWSPKQRGLIADLEQGTYFDAVETPATVSSNK